MITVVQQQQQDKSGCKKPKHIVSPMIGTKDPTVSFNSNTTLGGESATESATTAVGSAVVLTCCDDKLSDNMAKSTSFNKRVSFGNNAAMNVQTFIYENVLEDRSPQTRYCYNSPPPPHLSSPTKIKVELVDTQLPCCIEPPSEISVILADGTVAPASSLLLISSSSSSNNNNQTSGSTQQNFTASDKALIVSTTIAPPQIPSRKKMDDHENPFRPEGSLRTEVEPLIEGFKSKPFYHEPPTPIDDIDGSVGVGGGGEIVAVGDSLRTSSLSPQRSQNVSLPKTSSSSSAAAGADTDRRQGGSSAKIGADISSTTTILKDKTVRPTSDSTTTSGTTTLTLTQDGLSIQVQQDDQLVHHKAPPTSLPTASANKKVNNKNATTAAYTPPGGKSVETVVNLTSSNGSATQKVNGAGCSNTNTTTTSTVDVEHKVLTSPRLGQVELVHLDQDQTNAKKKRCAPCCVVQ